MGCVQLFTHVWVYQNRAKLSLFAQPPMKTEVVFYIVNVSSKYIYIWTMCNRFASENQIFKLRINKSKSTSVL